MIESIEAKYTKKESNWFCNICNSEIYSGKNYRKTFCNCLDKKIQNEIYINHLKKYYDIDDSKYICKICLTSIGSNREQHTLRCVGLGTQTNPKDLSHLKLSIFSNNCDMGCGQKSNFFHKNGKAYCCKFGAKCPVKVEVDRKSKIGINPFAQRNIPHPKGMLGKTAYNKGLTKETSEIVARTGLAIKKAYQLYGDQRINKNHTEETKQYLSEKMKQRYASGWEPVCGRCKKYKHSSPIAGEITVDGTWELAFAKILDKVGVKWERNRKRFDYINLEGGESTYQPDFFVQDWHTFVEVKGYQTDLDKCKWKQFDEPLLIIKRIHINKIKEWLKDGKTVSEKELYDLINDSTKEIN